METKVYLVRSSVALTPVVAAWPVIHACFRSHFHNLHPCDRIEHTGHSLIDNKVIFIPIHSVMPLLGVNGRVGNHVVQRRFRWIRFLQLGSLAIVMLVITHGSWGDFSPAWWSFAHSIQVGASWMRLHGLNANIIFRNSWGSRAISRVLKCQRLRELSTKCCDSTYFFNTASHIIEHVDFVVNDELVILQAEIRIWSSLPHHLGELLKFLSLKNDQKY